MATVTKTIGTVGRDYSTITAWEADLDNGAIYASGDHAVGECYDDSVFDESVDINGGGTIGLASITLTVAEEDRHDGTAGTGARLVASVANRQIRTSTYRASIFWLEINGNALKSASGLIRASGTTAIKRTIGNVIAHNSHGTAHSPYGVSIDGDVFCDIVNSIAYSMSCNANDNYFAIGLYHSGRVGHGVINCTVQGIDNQCPINRAGKSDGIYCTSGYVKNSVVVDVTTTTSTPVVMIECATQTTNATEDASAVGITGINPTTQFVSTLAGSEDLHLVANSACIRAGTDLIVTPTGVNIDIDGYDRDAGGKVWSIGAHEWVRTVTRTIGTSGRDYSTITAWEADLAPGAFHSVGDDVIGVIYDDSIFNENVVINQTGLDSITLTVAEESRHDGTAGTGVVIVPVTISPVVQYYNIRNITLEWFEINVGLPNRRCDGCIGVTTASNGVFNAYCRGIIVHGGYTYSHTISLGGYGGTKVIASNCVVYDREMWGNPSRTYDSGAFTTGQYSNAERGFINCTAHDQRNVNGGVNAQGFAVQSNFATNCIATDCDAAAFRGIAPTLTNCASNDGTGTLTGIVTADQYISTLAGAEDLKLKSGSDCIGAGSDMGTSYGANFDLIGRDRDAEGDVWDIGAHQYVVTTLIGSWNGIDYANIKSINGVTIANIKSINGIQ